MDPQITATREDLYHVQMDVKHVQAVQINHSDRLLRLEKRQADDAALKSVWGTGSPFPSVLGGTPQQGPVSTVAGDVFDDFDDEQGHSLLGSLQLDAEEEPVRRGASRANSVRFDVSAIQGSSWAQASRSSGDFGPIRPNSGLGSHPMTERSLSHKSDGRHSSAGHSVHSVPSGRTSSLGLDTNFLIGGPDLGSSDIPDPPPGLFILGSVPSIIRCWLSPNFSHNALLYAAVCTGSQKSTLDYSLLRELGYQEQMQKDSFNRHKIRLPVYLPEAIITQASSRSNSPAPQLPALTVNFEITGVNQRSNNDRKGIRVFIGSDTLRAHNADVLFSQNLMSLYGDDRNKLSVPFVRPENESLFKNLCTSNMQPERNELKATALPFKPTEKKVRVESALRSDSTSPPINGTASSDKALSDMDLRSPNTLGPISPQSPTAKVLVQNDLSDQIFDKPLDEHGISGESQKRPSIDTSTSTTTTVDAGMSDSARRENGVWGSWRQGGAAAAAGETETSSGYQRATRGGRGMKVLKASKPVSSTSIAPSRPVSATRTGTSYEPAPARTSGEFKRKSHGVENLRWESGKKTSGEEPKGVKTLTTMPRSSNPVGNLGQASAFAWMSTSKAKTSTTTAE